MNCEGRSRILSPTRGAFPPW